MPFEIIKKETIPGRVRTTGPTTPVIDSRSASDCFSNLGSPTLQYPWPKLGNSIGFKSLATIGSPAKGASEDFPSPVPASRPAQTSPSTQQDTRNMSLDYSDKSKSPIVRQLSVCSVFSPVARQQAGFEQIESKQNLVVSPKPVNQSSKELTHVMSPGSSYFVTSRTATISR